MWEGTACCRRGCAGRRVMRGQAMAVQVQAVVFQEGKGMLAISRKVEGEGAPPAAAPNAQQLHRSPAHHPVRCLYRFMAAENSA